MDKTALKKFLVALPNFSGVEETAIEWLIDKSEVKLYPKDSFVFQPGDALDHLMIYLEGSMDGYMDTPEGRQDLFVLESGTISGNLPFSRTKGIPVFGRALEDLTILKLHKSFFVEMVDVSYKLTQAFVAVMSDRIRDYSQSQFQDEKLKALGKISAGLAHELNNPVSAIARSSKILYDKLSQSPDNFKDTLHLSFSIEDAKSMDNLILSKIESYRSNPPNFSLLEQQDRLDELTDWMEDNDVDRAEEMSETLTEFDFTEDELDKIKEVMGDNNKLSATLLWMDHRLSVELIVTEIKEASSRVETLVGSIKEYSHMDHGLGKEEVNLHNGLRTTLSILGHQLKEKQIEIDKQFFENLPTINANQGELNQVWTNLISNAKDAVEQGGKITVSTFMDREYICVCIEDNGSGIPEDVMNHIWEPFYTTKKVGEGTGIGLDVVKKIVQKHRGTVRVESKPGNTRFIVQFYKS